MQFFYKMKDSSSDNESLKGKSIGNIKQPKVKILTLPVKDCDSTPGICSIILNVCSIILIV